MRRFSWVRCTVVALFALSGQALAQGSPGPAPAAPMPTGAPVGNTDTRGGTVAAQAPANVVIPACTQPSQGPATTPPPISVTVNAATTWQPRGGEVIVAVAGDASQFKGFTVRACFGWTAAPPSQFFTQSNLSHFTDAFVRVRPSDTSGLVNLGVVVPDLSYAPSSLWSRWFEGTPASGLGMVPIVDMRLVGYNDSGVLFDIVRPVGLTSVAYSLLLAVVGVAGGGLLLHRLAIGAFPAPAARPAANRLSAALGRLGEFAKLRWMLYLVQGSAGRASLSAFQILLWTMLVAASAIYVMALSGNLINITPGTLVLLGIAGAAGIVTAARGSPGQTGQGQAPPLVVPQPQPQDEQPPPVLPAAQDTQQRVQRWADLVRGDDDRPDVTRLQMLFFTAVSATFVAVQVLNNYVIPDIPSGYLILMGISNGIYVSRKFAGPN